MRRLTLLILIVLVLSALLVAPASAQTTVTYVVQPNDTLSSIARQYCTTWQQIYNMNRAVIGPNPNVLRAGTVLVVPNNCGGGTPPPGGGTVPCDRGPSAHANGPINGNVYLVVRGDTMFSIAGRFCTTVSPLASANGISNPWRIYAGQSLVIPGGGTAPTPTPTPTPPTSPFIAIASPLPNQSVPLTFTANGTGGGLFEGTVVVSAFAQGGQLLAQQATTLQGSNVGTGGSGTWQVTLTVNVPSGTAGFIQAASPQSNVTPATVSVIYGSAQPAASIAIQTPTNNATVAATFPVSGVGAGLFNSTIVVQAFAQNNQFLAQQTTTLQGSQVGTGGQGTWSVTMTVNVAAGTPGFVRAFSSQYPVSSQVNVIYGTGQPAQCSIVAVPGAPFFEFPGGPVSGSFSSAGGTFPAFTRSWFNNQYWYQFNLNPGSSGPTRWAPATSISGTTGSCPW